MPDHIHLFIGMRPHQSVSELVQKVKVESSKWIKEQNLCEYPFAWQEGYGAFSYAKSQVNDVIRHIQNQEAHHKKERFLDDTGNSLLHLRSTGMRNTFSKKWNST